MQGQDAEVAGQAGEGEQERVSVSKFLEDACIDYFRYVDGARMSDFYQLDIPEYLLIMRAMEIKDVDKSRWCHLGAWLGMKANNKKKSGKEYKLIYTTFEKFFDYEAALKKVRRKQGPESNKKNSGLSRLSKALAGKE